VSLQTCDRCNKLFEGGDLIRAVVLSRYVALKSARAYAIDKPTDCLELTHLNCQYPRTGAPEGD
jgi:hypothetical protein